MRSVDSQDDVMDVNGMCLVGHVGYAHVEEGQVALDHIPKHNLKLLLHRPAGQSINQSINCYAVIVQGAGVRFLC